MIGKIPVSLGSITPLQAPTIEAPIKPETGTTKSFGDILKQSISEVDSLQTEADRTITGVMTGTAGVSMHDAAIALQKADVAFQLMSTIRSKIIKAYEEVMRTQV